MINKENCIKKTSKKATIPIGYRISKDLSDWLKKENLSPRGLMIEAAKELGYKQGEKQ